MKEGACRHVYGSRTDKLFSTTFLADKWIQRNDFSPFWNQIRIYVVLFFHSLHFIRFGHSPANIYNKNKMSKIHKMFFDFQQVRQVIFITLDVDRSVGGSVCVCVCVCMFWILCGKSHFRLIDKIQLLAYKRKISTQFMEIHLQMFV